MKTFLTFLSLFSTAGLLFVTGCASQNEQGGAYGSTESSHEQYTSPNNPQDSVPRGEYWARDYPY